MVIHRARLGGGGASGTHTPKILNPRNDLDKFPPPCLPPPPQKKAETGRGGENREEGGGSIWIRTRTPRLHSARKREADPGGSDPARDNPGAAPPPRGQRRSGAPLRGRGPAAQLSCRGASETIPGQPPTPPAAAAAARRLRRPLLAGRRRRLAAPSGAARRPLRRRPLPDAARPPAPARPPAARRSPGPRSRSVGAARMPPHSPQAGTRR